MRGLILKFVCLIILFNIENTDACGIDLGAPQNHFDGVNEWGELAYWYDIGEIDADHKQNLPLVIGFNPRRKTSPYLGTGWIIPLLEANIVQLDEKRFVLTQPDGSIRRFGRRSPGETILQGEGDWKGDIKGNTITVWASCGWKMVFVQGKITSITTPQGDLISYKYSNGLVTDLSESGREILSVSRDPEGELVKLKYGKNTVCAELGEKPEVETIDGQRVVGKISRSLHRITLSDGSTINYDFVVDERKFPTLEITGAVQRNFTWNPADGHILRDGIWTYDIRGGEQFLENSNIERTNSQGQNESWFLDVSNGREIFKDIDGTTVLKTWFTSGFLANKIRSIESKKGDAVTYVYKPRYDDAGRLISINGTETLIEYKDLGEGNYRVTINDKGLIRSRSFDASGRIIGR